MPVFKDDSVVGAVRAEHQLHRVPDLRQLWEEAKRHYVASHVLSSSALTPSAARVSGVNMGVAARWLDLVDKGGYVNLVDK